MGISQILKAEVNRVETYNLANSISLTTRPNVRMFANPTNIGGTTHASFSNEWFLLGAFAKENIPKFKLAFYKLSQQAFGI